MAESKDGSDWMNTYRRVHARQRKYVEKIQRLKLTKGGSLSDIKELPYLDQSDIAYGGVRLQRNIYRADIVNSESVIAKPKRDGHSSHEHRRNELLSKRYNISLPKLLSDSKICKSKNPYGDVSSAQNSRDDLKNWNDDAKATERKPMHYQNLHIPLPRVTVKDDPDIMAYLHLHNSHIKLPKVICLPNRICIVENCDHKTQLCVQKKRSLHVKKDANRATIDIWKSKTKELKKSTDAFLTPNGSILDYIKSSPGVDGGNYNLKSRHACKNLILGLKASIRRPATSEESVTMKNALKGWHKDIKNDIRVKDKSGNNRRNSEINAFRNWEKYISTDMNDTDRNTDIKSDSGIDIDQGIQDLCDGTNENSVKSRRTKLEDDYECESMDCDIERDESNENIIQIDDSYTMIGRISKLAANLGQDDDETDNVILSPLDMPRRPSIMKRISLESGNRDFSLCNCDSLSCDCQSIDKRKKKVCFTIPT